ARYGRPAPSAANVNTSGPGAFVESYVTLIDVICDFTTRFATPTALPLVARIWAEPSVSACTRPVALTDATLGAVVDHVIVGCVARATLLPSTACAVYWNWLP